MDLDHIRSGNTAKKCAPGCVDSGHGRHPRSGTCQGIGDTEVEVSDGLGPVSHRDALCPRKIPRRYWSATTRPPTVLTIKLSAVVRRGAVRRILRVSLIPATRTGTHRTASKGRKGQKGSHPPHPCQTRPVRLASWHEWSRVSTAASTVCRVGQRPTPRPEES
jgi:hypothetical protein